MPIFDFSWLECTLVLRAKHKRFLSPKAKSKIGIFLANNEGKRVTNVVIN